MIILGLVSLDRFLDFWLVGKGKGMSICIYVE